MQSPFKVPVWALNYLVRGYDGDLGYGQRTALDLWLEGLGVKDEYLVSHAQYSYLASSNVLTGDSEEEVIEVEISPIIELEEEALTCLQSSNVPTRGNVR